MEEDPPNEREREREWRRIERERGRNRRERGREGKRRWERGGRGRRREREKQLHIWSTDSLTLVKSPAVSIALSILLTLSKYFTHLQLTNLSAVSIERASSIHEAASSKSPACYWIQWITQYYNAWKSFTLCKFKILFLINENGCTASSNLSFKNA